MGISATPPTTAHPTLWRTCRVLANLTRLQILRLLLRQPDQSVSALAAQLRLGLPAASQYLRALEARGLLTLRRKGRKVDYRVSATTPGTPAASLVPALRTAFQKEAHPAETVYRLVTAFTHPRRVELFRALNTEPQPLNQLGATTRISLRALLRHLQKLETRGFVIGETGRYRVIERRDSLGRELARLATSR